MMAKAGWIVAALLALASCGEGQMVGRAIDDTGPMLGASRAVELGTPVAAAYRVQRVNVIVPKTLEVSEENVFLPRADIVWHGDPIGDRHAQVKSVIDEAARRGVRGMTSGASVVVDIEILRFHALTPKTRYTVGGNFATRFLLTVKDARTGQVIDGPRLVVADCPASGGQKALDEERRGITERVVIVDHVSGVIARELSRRYVSPEAAAQAVSRTAFQPSDLAL